MRFILFVSFMLYCFFINAQSNPTIRSESTLLSLANLKSQNTAQEITPESRVIGDTYLAPTMNLGWIE